MRQALLLLAACAPLAFGLRSLSLMPVRRGKAGAGAGMEVRAGRHWSAGAVFGGLPNGLPNGAKCLTNLDCASGCCIVTSSIIGVCVLELLHPGQVRRGCPEERDAPLLSSEHRVRLTD